MGAIKEQTYYRNQQRRPWRTTPLIESAALSKAAGWYVTPPSPSQPRLSSPSRSLSRRSRIFLKLENLQPSGSFKSRGLGNLVLRSMERAREPEKVHFYASSGGNAGLGCVHAAVFVGRGCTVVVPTCTKPHMITKLLAAGATSVLTHGASIKDADAYLRSHIIPLAVARGEEPVYVSPFDHPDIWEGHSTMVDELADQFAEIGEDAPDLLICSCGGGGLFNGLMDGIANQDPSSAWEKTKVLAVNTVGADALARSLEKGENFTLPGITSIATSLGCARISDRTFELAVHGRRTGKAFNTVLTDAEAAMGCWRFAEDERILVEPACGVNIALCYGHRLKKALGRSVRRDEKVVIVVCGGSNVTPEMLQGWKREYGHLFEAGGMGMVRGHHQVHDVSSSALAVKPPSHTWLRLH